MNAALRDAPPAAEPQALQPLQPLKAALASVARLAEGVVALELRPVDRLLLPAFTAGAHVDLHLPRAEGVLIRQYSICSDPADTARYQLAVALEPASRGGSRHVHEQLRAGQVVQIGQPRNHFPLAEDAPHSVLVAGGIGITPLMAMARRLSALGRRWTLYLCARTPARAVFLREASALPHGQVVPVFDGMPGVASLDLLAVVAAASPGAHFYCCGPRPLMEAFGRATATLPPAQVHTEWFAAPAPVAPVAAVGSSAPAGPEGFEVRLHRSGMRLQVGAQESLLDALLRNGVEVASSCRDGICGTCEVRVLAGTPDHRDCVLSAEEAARGNRMLVCVSRCRGDALELDL